MFNVMTIDRLSFGKLIEGGSGVLSYHTPETVELGVAEAIKYNYRTVYTSSNFIPLHKELLAGKDKIRGNPLHPSRSLGHSYNL